ncbi:hypothetical protein NC653_031114 [Populus alba x Populus x berolinensis]|uniref:Uncharacterized protein n=1 Tax=Populus alba x Populus x berolinensis TaxID=444605 RepID=A0AAD6LYS9_9ROSI|nr:hypothetical protein NC653_031114 [Populus alba x Populus x berolinensis]
MAPAGEISRNYSGFTLEFDLKCDLWLYNGAEMDFTMSSVPARGNVASFQISYRLFAYRLRQWKDSRRSWIACSRSCQMVVAMLNPHFPPCKEN